MHVRRRCETDGWTAAAESVAEEAGRPVPSSSPSPPNAHAPPTRLHHLSPTHLRCPSSAASLRRRADARVLLPRCRLHAAPPRSLPPPLCVRSEHMTAKPATQHDQRQKGGHAPPPPHAIRKKCTEIVDGVRPGMVHCRTCAQPRRAVSLTVCCLCVAPGRHPPLHCSFHSLSVPLRRSSVGW